MVTRVRQALAAVAGLSVLFASCSNAAPTGSSASPATSTASPAASAPAPRPTPRVTPAPTGAIGEGQIVFEDWMISASRHQLYVDNLDGNGPRSLVRSAFDDARPAISPDGTQVLFIRIGDGLDKLILTDVDGSDARSLGDGPCGDLCNGAEDPEWSPDGKGIVFKRAFFDDAGNFLKIGLVIVDLADGDATEVTMHKAGPDHRLKAGDDFEDIEPDWSPDGRRIAFARTDNSTADDHISIFTIGIDGKDLQQVTPWDLGASEPNWSPDGSRIAFNVPGRTFQGGEQNIFTIRPDGTDLVQITAHLKMGDGNVQATFDPCWSPDGSRLIFTHFPSTNDLADLFVVGMDGAGLDVFARTRQINESHAHWGIDPAP